MPKKILIIEDDRNICELLSHILQGNGYETIIAFTGKDGLRLSRECLPDGILLDILLPDISGFEVLKALKLNESTKSIPVLMCTEKKQIGDIEQAVSLGAEGYITKPFDVERLLQKIIPLTER